jgi:hypothetical protein
MSFHEFEESITSPRLRAIAQHWAKARGPRKIPAWSDISPSAISEHLAIVFAYSYDAARDEFFGRLAGNAIAGVSQSTFKGTALSEIRPSDQYPRALHRAKRIVSEAVLYRGVGLMYVTESQKMLGEKIVLPLAGDGMTPDGIFGATDYQIFADYHPTAQEMTTEIESWFTT